MTSYYKQTSITDGMSWKRCHDIRIRNFLNEIPSINFQEEEILKLSETEFTKIPRGSTNCTKEFDPTSGQINLIDPETGISTGETITHMKLYQILHSLYIQTALERDVYAAEQAAQGN